MEKASTENHAFLHLLDTFKLPSRLKKFHFTLRSRESASFVRARYLLVQLKKIDK